MKEAYRVSYKFNEGNSAAVRRPVKLNNFLWQRKVSLQLFFDIQLYSFNYAQRELLNFLDTSVTRFPEKRSRRFLGLCPK